VPKFTLDTNVFVDALRSSEGAAGLKRFLATSLPSTWMSAVVMLELRSGARTAAQVTALESGLIEPFSRRNRVLVPTARAYLEAGRILAELGGGGSGRGQRRAPASFVTDVLMAASCRENGVTLVTRDTDFAVIAKHLPGLKFVPPWP
jgi:predicted nucleic acid-binding protein